MVLFFEFGGAGGGAGEVVPHGCFCWLGLRWVGCGLDDRSGLVQFMGWLGFFFLLCLASRFTHVWVQTLEGLILRTIKVGNTLCIRLSLEMPPKHKAPATWPFPASASIQLAGQRTRRKAGKARLYHLLLKSPLSRIWGSSRLLSCMIFKSANLTEFLLRLPLSLHKFMPSCTKLFIW